MRKFILIAAMVLASASAEAGGSRGLILASNDDPAVGAQPAPADASAPATAPTYIQRPAAVDAKAAPEQPKADAGSDAKPAAKAQRRVHHESTEARVIYELHRHGIYW